MALRKVSYFGGFRFFSDWLNNGNEAAKIEGEDGIKDQDYSLNPGRYVGVGIEDDGLTEEEFKK